METEQPKEDDVPVGLLSWEETATAMAAADEDWSEWDEGVGDGVDDL
jgi:hypothetical protein